MQKNFFICAYVQRKEQKRIDYRTRCVLSVYSQNVLPSLRFFFFPCRKNITAATAADFGPPQFRFEYMDYIFHVRSEYASCVLNV